jgi:hypothetical protein
MLAYKDGARVHLVSRKGRDHTRRFRDIAAAISKLSARTLVLDGEVAIYDQQLRSRLISPMPARCGRLPAVSLLTELDALYTEHGRCGDLDAGVDDVMVWIALRLRGQHSQASRRRGRCPPG